MSVYRFAIENGDYDLSALVAESGIRCPRCGTADCAKYHDTWYRRIIHDLCSGEVFKNFPILRIKFCDGSTKSLHPVDLWRGKATISSTLEASSVAVKEGVGGALQFATNGGDGEEPVSERTIGRWVKRVSDRIPVASAALNFSTTTGEPAAEKLENFLSQLHHHHLLTLRSQWGFSLLDVPSPAKATNTATFPKPVFENPRPPQSPPSGYLPRGTKSSFCRRGPPPDD